MKSQDFRVSRWIHARNSTTAAPWHARCGQIPCKFPCSAIETKSTLLRPQPRTFELNQQRTSIANAYKTRFHVASCRKNFRLFSSLAKECRRLHATWMQHERTLRHRPGPAIPLRSTRLTDPFDPTQAHVDHGAAFRSEDLDVLPKLIGVVGARRGVRIDVAFPVEHDVRAA